ncbi:PREDICTED: GBF-interacting protein 1-like [Tarenaya hassleriana]|uniref:GBF-interacting protein 1-like n=1 Tax=Tarenaya hassleriana TaxID=28532 RepID=UPI00053C0C84|nr:PREDICTED: GBF-interacting protein 1-like [Tarenaya hassleriana]
MVGGGTRVSMSASTRKMIQSIKEITAGNYSEDEILVMLHECDMDPDETAQRLLLQDPFHEVKRKRDKRKENLSNKDAVESQWGSSGQGRGNRGGRVNFSSRHTVHDTGSAKNSFKKENGSKQVTDSSIPTSQKTKKEESASSFPAILDNGSTGLPSQTSSVQHASNLPANFGQPKATGSSVSANKLGEAAPSVELTQKNQGPKPGNEQTPQEQHAGEHRYTGRPQGVGKVALSDPHGSRPTSAHSNSTGSRPSSNYSNRLQQTVGHQRGGSVKEWKPKPVNLNPVQGSGASAASEVPAVPSEPSEKASSQEALPSVEATSKLQKQLEDLHIQQRQHVIFPNHILVSEAERTMLSFGSFDAGFSLTSNMVTGPENDKSSTPLSRASHDAERSLEEGAFSNQNASMTEKEGDIHENSESPSQVQDDLAVDGVISASTAAEYNEPKQESISESENHQNSSHDSQNYGIGLPPALGSQLPQFENTDPQSRDAFRIQSFVVQQPIDPASYYAQFYHSNSDSDGRVSPFISPGVATKFNGSVTVLPPHSSQSLQEGGNTLVMSAASPTPLVTQPAGLMQNSVPVFRPPGMHVSPYPPNYMPYGHYFSPFYVSPHSVHQVLSNGAFPQQPQASGGVFPAPGASTGGKYSLPQYRTGTNSGSLTYVGTPSGYGPYGSSTAGYSPISAMSTGNPTANDDLNTPQLKDSNGYTTGHQGKALPVWITGGRDVSNLPPNSFCNLQHQGQHMAYAPTQAGHITFPGMYHPTQAVAAAGVHPLLQQSQVVAGPDMVAPGPNVFQQPQQTQMNWPSNY